jgi:hypothetical protein
MDEQFTELAQTSHNFGFLLQHDRTSSQQMQAGRMPLPFRYETTETDTETATHFTNTLDPLPRAHDVFGFHRPETRRGGD